MSEEKKECYRTTIGGQALIEGVMMRGPQLCAMATRMPDGRVDTEVWNNKPRAWYKKVPFLRGIFNLLESLIDGYKCLMKSAEKSSSEPEEESRFEQWLNQKLGDKVSKAVSILASALGVVLALFLFLVIPTYVVKFLDMAFPLGGFKTLLEGCLKIAILICYMALVARVPEIRRVFEYHGAEHKTIACYEAGEELTVERVRCHIRFHPRCGTSFILIVLIISIAVNSFVPWGNGMLRVLYKILLLPVVVGIAYEIIKLAGRHDNVLTKAISAPGLWLQHITTKEPHDDQIEVAIASMKPVIPKEKGEDQW